VTPGAKPTDCVRVASDGIRETICSAVRAKVDIDRRNPFPRSLGLGGKMVGTGGFQLAAAVAGRSFS